MIPRPAITQWARNVAWPTEEQIEQDLLLSRLIIEIVNEPYLGDELIFRGGTCLHKLHMSRPLRYSEDLDYVRRTDVGIAVITRAATRVGESLGMDVRTRISEHPKILFRAPFESGSGRMRIKIESTRSSVHRHSLRSGCRTPSIRPGSAVRPKSPRSHCPSWSRPGCALVLWGGPLFGIRNGTRVLRHFPRWGVP